jgi:hypothetical protein
MEDLLSNFGIRTLPILADALPLLINDDGLDYFADAVEPLKLLRCGNKKHAA